jgi:chromosome segregation ATPase
MSDADKTEEMTFEQQVMEQFANLNRRLSMLETKVDERLRETRPIWQQLVSDVAEVKSDVAAMKSEVADVKSEAAGIKKVLELTNHKLDQVILEVADVRAQCRMMNAQISRLEQDAPAAHVK